MHKYILILLVLVFLPIKTYGVDKLSINYQDGIYHIEIPYNQTRNNIDFVLSEKLITNQQIHKKIKSKLTINAGFFDPNNSKTISFIYNDGILAENPLMNENIINNPDLMENWNKISNRAEFRVIKMDDGYVYDITNHNQPFEGELIASGQGGPMLLPQMDLENEYFVVKDGDNVLKESASVLHKTARTLIGLKDNNIHILIVTDKNPMTIYEAKKLCESYGLEKAMAFDGGSSTSLNYKNKIQVVSTGIKGDDTGRKLKSFLIYK